MDGIGWTSREQLNPRYAMVRQRTQKGGETAMTRTIHGIADSRTIEPGEDLGVAEGQPVEVQVKVPRPTQPWGAGILRTAGALADDPHWDGIMDEIHKARKLERRPPTDEE